MFLTLDRAEVPIGSFLEGGHAWRYVEFLSSFPYFHVSALDLDDGLLRPTTLLIHTVPDLLDLASAHSNGWDIVSVQLVSSGRINGTGQWRMDELQEIIGVEMARGTSYAYILYSGVTYFDHEAAKELPKQQWQSVFLAKQTQ